MNEQYKKQLIERYVAGEATERELLAFFGLIHKGELDELIAQHMDSEIETLRHQPAAANKTTNKKWLIAAITIAAISIPTYLLLFNKPANNTQLAQNQLEQISPVNHDVTLTLANGKKVKLNKGFTGQIAANVSQQDSLLNYQKEKNTNPAETTAIADNTLTNNSAEKFTVTLSDGTQATLDVASTLTYPSAFKKDRKVTMTGQVYFKVKHDVNKPFTLTTGTDKIEDIGTEFNVNAYEQAKTTLISGAVKVSENEKSVTLKPGEQSTNLTIKPANTEEVLAWLQGQIIFHHESLESILKTVARVYDVNFVWEDPETKKLTFGGSVSRTDKLANVLNYFRKAGKVDFKVEGKTVKVYKRTNK